MEQSLIITHGSKEIFSSHSKWLYPLFELEDFFKSNTYNIGDLMLTDKIAGKAAAFLIIRLGFKNVHIHIISEGAVAVFQKFNISLTYDQLVPRIQCKTEDLVSRDDTPDNVWQMLRRRAGRVAGLSVDIENLSVSVNNQIVIEDLNLKVGKGEHIFIKGPNGSGKTTLLKSILGIQKFNSGVIKIGDFQVGSNEWSRNRSFVGYVPQGLTNNSFPFSASEVVEIAFASKNIDKREKDIQIEIAMRRTGCFNLANRPFNELSGGEKQRVNIARCLCQQAKVLLLDEPTSFLDRKSKDDLFDLLIEVWANEAPTAIIVSHDYQWIDKFGWHVYEMNDKKIC